MSDDDTWLERHTREKFGGKLPALQGPFCLDALYMPLKINRRLCFKGLPECAED